MTAHELLSAATAARVVPLFYEPDPERALAAVEGLARGGARLVEYTLRGDGAEAVLERLVASAPRGVAIGAGTVRDVAGARAALAAGAAFVVGPNGDAAVAEVCRDAGVAYVPGCLTPTEVAAALSWGCPLVKVFPVSAVGGPGYLKALRGPMPRLRAMATGGVGRGDVAAYLAAGATCVGMGSELVPPAAVRDRDRDTLAAAMRSVLEDATGDSGGGRPVAGPGGDGS